MIRVLYISHSSRNMRDVLESVCAVFGAMNIDHVRTNLSTGRLITYGGIEIIVVRPESGPRLIESVVGQSYDMVLLDPVLTHILENLSNISLIRPWYDVIKAVRVYIRPTVVKPAEPKTRFMLDMDGSMVPDEDGEWVRYE